jgi:hypothetical protein
LLRKFEIETFSDNYCFMNEWITLRRLECLTWFHRKLLFILKCNLFIFKRKYLILTIKTVVLKFIYFLILNPVLRSRTSFLPLFSGFRLFSWYIWWLFWTAQLSFYMNFHLLSTPFSQKTWYSNIFYYLNK